MGLLDIFRRTTVIREVQSSIPTVKRRNYAGAQITARYSDFRNSNLSADAELEQSLHILRNRSRNLERNNPHVRRYIQLMQDNIIGHSGFQLQVRAFQPDGKTYDTYGNDAIESVWTDWARVATSDGLMTFIEACRMVVRTWSRDGEVFIQKRSGRKFGTLGVAFKFVESDHVDETLNRVHPGSKNRIRMGIEIDEDDRPVAYHVLTTHPGEHVWAIGNRKYVRIPANEMIHIYVKSRPGQTRGEPPMCAIMTDAKMLAGYREAEITNRRLAAAKSGFFVRDENAGPVSGVADAVDPDSGQLQMEVEPGVMSVLPNGYDFKAFDASASQTDYAAFERQILRSIAAGLGPSYFDLAMDLENVSYSSVRQGALSDRDFYRGMQRFFIDRFAVPVYAHVLQNILDFGETGLPSSPRVYAKFLKAATFRPRGWQWVDPQNEVKAAIEARKGRMASLTSQLAEQGLDFEEVAMQIAEEDKLLETLGIDMAEVAIAKPVAKE